MLGLNECRAQTFDADMQYETLSIVQDSNELMALHILQMIADAVLLLGLTLPTCAVRKPSTAPAALLDILHVLKDGIIRICSGALASSFHSQIVK